MSYRLDVYGYLWSGAAKGTYSYTCTCAPTNNSEARKYAGDFRELIDWRVVKCTTDYVSLPDGFRRTYTEKVVRPFRDKRRERMFV